MEPPYKAVEFIIENSAKYAEAKAKRIYITEFRKSKKALLFANAIGNTIADKENYAYSHPEYIEVLDDLKKAVAVAEKLRWMLVASQARIDVYRTQEASNRNIDRSTQ